MLHQVLFGRQADYDSVSSMRGDYVVRQRFVLVLSLIGLLLLSSCALLFKGEDDTVDFNTEPAGAEVFIDGVSYGTTPVSVQLKASETYTVSLRYQDQERTIMIQNQVGALWVVLDILGGLVPLIVDAATGAWYELEPNQVYFEFN